MRRGKVTFSRNSNKWACSPASGRGLRSSRDGTIFHIDLKPSLCPVGSKSKEISLCSISPWSDQFWNTHVRYGRPIQLKISWQSKKYNEEHRGSRIARGQQLLEMSYKERYILLNWNIVQHQNTYLQLHATRQCLV